MTISDADLKDALVFLVFIHLGNLKLDNQSGWPRYCLLWLRSCMPNNHHISNYLGKMQQTSTLHVAGSNYGQLQKEDGSSHHHLHHQQSASEFWPKI